MKASEVIVRLQEMIAIYGDLGVYLQDTEWGDYMSVTDINMTNSMKSYDDMRPYLVHQKSLIDVKGFTFSCSAEEMVAS